MPSQHIKYSIVIPCYCSGAWLDELLGRISKAMAKQSESFEVILVNDASPDDTWKTIGQLVNKYPFLRGIDLSINSGQYRSTICGVQQSRGEFIITMDDDLQHQPEDLPTLILAIEQEPELDCVIGRLEKKKHSLFRRTSSRIVNWMFVHLHGKPPGLSPSAFRIMRRPLALTICSHATVNSTFNPLIYRTTRRIGNSDVTHADRPGGGSAHSLRKMAMLVLDNIFSSSTLPLRIVSILGICCALGSFAAGVYYLAFYYVRGFSVPGFATTVLLNLFFGGMILFAIGLLGEYLIRILDEVKQPPRYVVRSEVGGSNEDSSLTDQQQSNEDKC